jgi:hypothetical protein
MALVDYASSSSDEDIPNPSTTASKGQAIGGKRKHDTQESANLPPLPSKFHDLYASTTRASTRDDPSLHAGRKRGTPHIEGNWPTHLYIECTFSVITPPNHGSSLTHVRVSSDDRIYSSKRLYSQTHRSHCHTAGLHRMFFPIQ